MQKLLAFVENNLLLLAVLAAAFGLLVPSVGIALSGSIGPLLAALMLVISLTFDAHAVKLVLRKPDRQLWALGLVYGPMSLAGWVISQRVRRWSARCRRMSRHRCWSCWRKAASRSPPC
jgi:BASS family bile acid:Na+ symporter